MFSLSRLLWRLVAAGIGLSLAIVASLIVGVLGLGAIDAGERAAVGDMTGIVAFVLHAMRGSLILPLFPAIVWPAWAAAIVLGEVTATRSLFAHLVVATGIAVVGVMGGAPLLAVGEIRVIAAIGLVAGFTHWLVAGRGAGVADPRPVARTVEGATRPMHDGAAKNGISGENSNP
jgi:hypothetical protein